MAFLLYILAETSLDAKNSSTWSQLLVIYMAVKTLATRGQFACVFMVQRVFSTFSGNASETKREGSVSSYDESFAQ